MAGKRLFKVKGVDELVKKFGRLRGPTLRKVYRKAMRAAARPVLSTAKQIVRVASGKLRRTLKIRALKRSRKLIGVAIVPGTRSQLGVEGSGFYPTHIAIGFKGRGGGTKFPGNRYLRDAVLLEENDAVRTISSQIKSGMEGAIK